MNFYFYSPYFLILLVLIPLFFLKNKRIKNTSSHPLEMSAIPFIVGSGHVLENIPVPALIKYRSWILGILKSITFIFFVIALARPQTGTFATEEDTDARDLLLTLDTSGSMKALDFQLEGQETSRLEALKSVVSRFVAARKGDRMGLVVFGAEVFTQCPLTLDHDLLQQFINNLEIGMAGDSTSLGDALALSVKRLKEIPSKSKAIILVTDGLKTSGQIEPRQAAEIAKRLNIRVYTIGIGGKAPAPFPVQDMFGRTAVILKEVPLDEQTLELIAKTTGGRYFNAVNTDDLIKVYSEIDKLETRSEKTPRLVSEEEHFEIFLMLAFLFLLITELSARTIFRVIS